ncbi:MAG: DUF4340 domain-containing protein [Sutterellaceae bacterium]|nr:DUF4340 domain-containing protein [Burkholderiaceae bacterium]MDW8428947.1 DUF4340 domain-containing protein [Sutterellaceae bacterium]
MLAAALYWRADPLAAPRPQTPLLTADISQVDRLRLEGPVAADKRSAPAVELVKRDGKWRLPGYFDAPADAAKVEDLLKRVREATRGLPVATSRDAMTRLRVADDAYERRLSLMQGEKTLATIYLGTSSGARKAHARAATDSVVYAVSLAPFEVRTSAPEWLDVHLLKPDMGALTEITIRRADGKTVVLRRAERKEGEQSVTIWRGDGELVADENRARALVDAITNLRVDAVLGTEPQPQWRLEAAALTITLTSNQGQSVHWTLAKLPNSDSHVVKASNQAWYLEVKSWNARPLLDAVAGEKTHRHGPAKS